MKKNLIYVIIIMIMLYLSACVPQISDMPNDITKPLDDSKPTLTNETQFSKDLQSGRWSGELILDFYDGAAEVSLTKNHIYIKIDAEFNQISNNLSEMEMVGYINFIYDTPEVVQLPEGIISVEFIPEKNHYFGPYQAIVSSINWPEKYEKPAQVNFLDITSITGGVSVTITTDDNPPLIQTFVHGANEGAYYASDLYMLRQMSFITLYPEGNDRAIFGPHQHLMPSASGIEDKIYGYLEKVTTSELTQPLQDGELIETSRAQATKARIENQFGLCKLLVEPNTSVQYSDDNKDLLTLFYGRLYVRLDKLTEDRITEILLPQAVAAVRGTDFFVHVVDETTSIIKVYSGMVEVDFANQRYELNENQGLFIFGKEGIVDEFTFDGSYIPPWWAEDN